MSPKLGSIDRLSRVMGFKPNCDNKRDLQQQQQDLLLDGREQIISDNLAARWCACVSMIAYC